MVPLAPVHKVGIPQRISTPTVIAYGGFPPTARSTVAIADVRRAMVGVAKHAPQKDAMRRSGSPH